MKVFVFVLFVAVYVDCRKIYTPINKNANIDFINMESGGVRGRPPVVEPAKPVPVAPAGPVPAPSPVQPVPQPTQPVSKPASPSNPSSVPAAKPATPQKPVLVPQPPQPAPKPVPVNVAPAANPTTTPGPGSVKSLINFYDSKGNASPIRPYSYSQAVKQG